eukprot:gene7301-9356_t
MAQGSPQSVNEFRIMVTSMEKVMNRIVAKKQSRKLGRFPVSTVHRIQVLRYTSTPLDSSFQFLISTHSTFVPHMCLVPPTNGPSVHGPAHTVNQQPSSRQCDNADSILTEAEKKKGVDEDAKNKRNVAIPMFHAKGMVIERAGGEQRVSPYYFSLEDLKEDWAKMAAASKDQSVPKNPKVNVVDFTEVMCLAQGLSSATLPVPGVKKGNGHKAPPPPSLCRCDRCARTLLLTLYPSIVLPAVTAADTSSASGKDAALAVATSAGIVPPRREIGAVEQRGVPGTSFYYDGQGHSSVTLLCPSPFISLSRYAPKGGWGPGAVWEGGGELCASSIGAWWGTRRELRKNDVFRISVDGEG